MSNLTSILDLLSASQPKKEVTANELFNGASPSLLYAMRARTTSGVTWGYYGGVLQIGEDFLVISNGTVTLTPSAINFIEADDTGAVSVNTTDFTSGMIPLYKVIMGTSAPTDYLDYRTGATSMGGMVGVIAAANDTADAAVAAHTAEADPHPQYLTPAEGDTRYDDAGTAVDLMIAHNAESDPHPQYLTTAEGDARYAMSGAALSDGDKGDIVVASSGASLTIDSAVLSTFGRTLIDDADAATARTTLELGSAAVLAADTDTTLSANSDTRSPTQKAVKAYVDSLVTSGASDVMVFKGVIDCSANPNYPAADAGYLYKISVAGKIGGASGVNVEAGDTIYCLADSTSSGNHATVGASWGIAQANLDGAVIGPASATDSSFALFNGTGGKLVKDSGVLLSTDGTFAANSDSKLPSEKAIKTYIASAVSGAALTDGDKGDIVVSGSGTTLTIDSGVLSTFGRTLTDDVDAAAARATLGLGTVATLASDTDTSLSANSDTKVATQKAVKAYVDSIVTGGASDVMIFKGVIDCSASPAYPAADAGNVYKVSVAGKIGGSGGPNVEAGDTLYCIADGTLTGNHVSVGGSWVISQVNIDGAVVGPTTATDNAVALFNGTTGKIVKDSAVTLSTDGTFASNSDSKLPSEKAIKTYVTSAVSGTVTPGGSNTQLQFNDSGSLGGASQVAWDKTNNILYLGASSGSFMMKGVAGATSSDNGSNITIQGGTGAAGGAGGKVTICGGTPGSGGTPNGVLIAGCDPTLGTGIGGDVTIKGGPKSGTAGNANLLGGDTATIGTGGTTTVRGGDGVGSNTTSGPAVVRGGDGTGGGSTGGDVTVRGGVSTRSTISGNPAPGNATLAGGDATGNLNQANGGTATVKGGSGGVNGGAGGAVVITGGTATGGNGGSVSISGSAGVGTNKNGGSVTLTPGAPTGTGTPGHVVLNGSGAALSTSAIGGFTCLPTCSGTPTGTPAGVPTGTVPMVYDSTNKVLYAYTGGSWNSTGVVGAQPFDVTGFYPGVPGASAIVTRVPVARAVAFPSGLTGSVCKASSSATASTVFDIQKNGVSVGSITFAAGATSATFTAASAFSLAAGDLLSIIAPASPDATLANVGFVLAGTR